MVQGRSVTRPARGGGAAQGDLRVCAWCKWWGHRPRRPAAPRVRRPLSGPGSV